MTHRNANSMFAPRALFTLLAGCALAAASGCGPDAAARSGEGRPAENVELVAIPAESIVPSGPVVPVPERGGEEEAAPEVENLPATEEEAAEAARREAAMREAAMRDARRPPLDQPAAETPPPRFQFLGRESAGAGNITFSDLEFKFEQGDEFKRELLGEKIESIDGKKIRLTGFMHPSSSARASYFILVKDNQQCCFGPGAYPYHNVRVQMEEGKKAEFTTRPITVEGEFRVEPWLGPDGDVWAVFYLTAESAR